MTPQATREALDASTRLGGRPLVLLASQIRQLAPKSVPAFESINGKCSPRYRVKDGAIRLGLVLAVAKPARLGQRFDVRKGRVQTGVSAPELQFAHPRSVDQQRTVREVRELAMSRGVATTAIIADLRRALMGNA